MKKYVFLLFLLVLLIIFSNTTYEQQSLIPLLQLLLASQPFTPFLSQFEFTYWGRTISVEQSGYFHFVEFIIRKGTHFSFFGLIGVVIFYVLRRVRFAPLLAIIAVFILGCLDEYRQSFSPDRTGTIKDLYIDTAGAIVFVTVAYVVVTLRRKKTRNERT